MTRREAALESTVSRWIAARSDPRADRVAALLGPVRARVIATHAAGAAAIVDPDAAYAEVRVAGARFVVAGSSRPVRALATRMLGGPEELDAPRALTAAERAIWVLAVATALEDLGVAGEVWPLVDPPHAELASRPAIELVVEAASSEAAPPGAAPPVAPITVTVVVPADLELRAPPARRVPAWPVDVPVILGACALAPAAVAALGPRDVVVLGGGLALVWGDGTIPLRAAPGAVEAEVATGYVPRAMALPDDAQVELTVQLGTVRMTLRQLSELVPGHVVALGRPLVGPFEVHVGGRLVGHGELVDVDGELGVRIVSIAQSQEESR